MLPTSLMNLRTLSTPRTDHRPRLRLALGICLGLGAVGWIALVLAATRAYPGNRFLFLTFVLVYTSMAALILPKPRLYGYTFLAAFLFLGFCAKSIAYLGLGVALIEPTGKFDGSGYAWDSALLPAMAGSAAVITIRLIHLVMFRGAHEARFPFGSPPPAWYVRMRFPILAASFVGFVVLNGLNFVLTFYQIGLTPKLVLSAHLSVIVEWLFVGGFAMWVATLVGWEAQVRPGRFGSLLIVAFGEAVASLSTLSRAAYLFRALSYLLVAAEFPAFFRAQLTRRWRLFLAVLVPFGLAFTVASVSLLRFGIYAAYFQPALVTPTPTVAAIATPSPSVATTSSLVLTPSPTAGSVPVRITRSQEATREVGLLVVGRWIGIEGTMAVSSYPGLSVDTFRHALTESPSIGEAAFYQRLAGSTYHTTAQYEFLTTPGTVAILYYSGSLAIVALGMGLLTALLFAFEMITSRLSGNALTVSIVAMTLANAVAQMQFPYLFLVFLVEQAVAVAALGLLSRGLSWRAAGLKDATASPIE